MAVTASLLLVLALSGVAAGANQNATPKKWVSTLCSSFVAWQDTVKTEFNSLNTTVTRLRKGGNTDPTVLKPKVIGFLGRIVRSTHKLLVSMRAVGAPSIKNGAKLQRELLAGLGQLDEAFKSAQAAAQMLPTSSRKAFSQSATRLATTMKANVERINVALSSLSRYSTKELIDALKQDKTCAKLS